VALIPNAWTGFDFGLGEDLDRLRLSISGFARDKIAPRAAEIDRSNTFPRDLWPQIGEQIGRQGCQASISLPSDGAKGTWPSCSSAGLRKICKPHRLVNGPRSSGCVYQKAGHHRFGEYFSIKLIPATLSSPG
jgi:hypothetical protein